MKKREGRVRLRVSCEKEGEEEVRMDEERLERYSAVTSVLPTEKEDDALALRSTYAPPAKKRW
mgnify:CR=1 FL=1